MTYEPLENLEKGQATLLKQRPEGTYGLPDEALVAMVAEFGIMAVKGVMDVSREGIRNKDYPHVKPLTGKKTKCLHSPFGLRSRLCACLVLRELRQWYDQFRPCLLRLLL